MKKWISYIVTLLICLNFFGTTCSLSYYNENKVEPQSAAMTADQEVRSTKRVMKYLAVFIEFSDNQNTKHIDDAQCIQNVEKIFNSEFFDMNTTNGVLKVPSVKKYYEMQSYNKLSITTEIFPKVNGVVASYVDANPIGYYLRYNEKDNPIGYKDSTEQSQREEQLINNAVTAIAKQVEDAGITSKEVDTDNNGIIDAISFFIEAQSGCGSISWGDLLWSHMSSNKNITQPILGKQVKPYNLIYVNDYEKEASEFSLYRGGYGTIIHEFGHTLGYMDLYRHNAPTNRPVGFFDIMGNTIGSNPQNFLTYFISEHNTQNNWHSPLKVVNQTSNNVTLYKPEFQDENEMRAIKIQPYIGSQEYFIVEYHEKQNTYSDYCVDESGIIVYRVNDTYKNSGNVSGGDHGERDNIFVFRPNENTLGEGKGELKKATLNMKRTTLGKEIDLDNTAFDNQTIYYSDGSNSGIIIDVVSQTDKSVTFNITFPKVEGEGTKEKPYLIYDINTFLYVMKNETKDKYYKLMNDLDFANISDYPKINFRGNLNGNNKTLKNISTVGTGVFYNIGDYNVSAVIENLNVENITINPEKGNYLGGFACTVEDSTLKNIHLKSGYVKNVPSLNDIASTGGFAGNVNNKTIIDNCSSAIDVSSERNAGGFIGINMNATIKNSYASGNVSGKVNVGSFIGLQCISDAKYQEPQNVYFDYSKTKMSKAVGGYYSALHNLAALPAGELGKGIVGISVPEQITINNTSEANYTITTTPNTKLSFSIRSSDPTVAKYVDNKIEALKNGTAQIYVDLTVGTQVMRMQTKVNITNTTSISETEVLKHFGLVKKNEYVVGFKLGSSVANVKKSLSSYPNVKLSSFKNASGSEISSGTVATNMKFTLVFNQKQYHYTVVVKGDVNGDGLVYATDYVKIKNHIMGKKKLEGAYLKAADINNDNNIYATDYVRIKNYIMGKGSIEQKF